MVAAIEAASYNEIKARAMTALPADLRRAYRLLEVVTLETNGSVQEARQVGVVG